MSAEIFPALLAASTDPAGLRLLPTAEAPAAAEEDPAEEDPGTETTTNPTPAAPETDGGENSGEEGAAQEVAKSEAHDLHAPEIRVLGPVEVTGVDSTGHGPRIAQLAALLYFRPGRSADILCADMDPVSPWSASTLNARLQGLRRSLGSDPAGHPYVPRRSSGDDPYRLSPNVRCDWTRFLQLAERALPLGPAGLPDLERALTLARGRPFGGRPLPWAEPYQQEMITRIIDVAHTVATYRTPAGPHHDLSAARQAVATGLDADDTAELLYRDWLRIEHAAGNRQGLHTAIARVQQVNRAMDCSLESETEHLINDLLSTPHPHRTQQQRPRPGQHQRPHRRPTDPHQPLPPGPSRNRDRDRDRTTMQRRLTSSHQRRTMHRPPSAAPSEDSSAWWSPVPSSSPVSASPAPTPPYANSP
jgi:hypothetical protein